MNSRRYPNTTPANLRAGYPFLLPVQADAVEQKAICLLPCPVAPVFHEEAAPTFSFQPTDNTVEQRVLRTRPQILVADDEEFNRDLIVAILGDEYDVLTAGSGQEALETAAKHLPDLILLDVMMPRVDGFDVCARLKANAATQDIVVMFISALDDRGFETMGLELGAVDFITKPILPGSVRARVNNQMKQKRALEHFTELAEMEKTLRLDVLEALVLQSRDSKMH